VKLIAEPWDVGPGGYQVGNFPPGWTEWNGKYRDTVRKFWKGDGGQVSEFATRLAGSSDLYQDDGRKPYNSINFITCHDGFSLQDLVSYNSKHNEDNGEENRDGTDDNNSWNGGVEGPSDDPALIALREKQKRNLIATLVLSQGVPMILGGDEFSHTQKGNNNTYCQDNDLTWLHWELCERQQNFLTFVKKVIRVWGTQPVFQRRKFFKGRAIRGSDIKDISFLNPSGNEMTDEDWNAGSTKCIGVRLAGDLIGDEDERGEPIVGDTLLLLLNAHHEPIPFTLPLTKGDQRWEQILDTAEDSSTPTVFQGQEKYPLKDRSLAILRTQGIDDTRAEQSSAQVEAVVRAARPPLPGRPPLD
jgi:isoamylase